MDTNVHVVDSDWVRVGDSLARGKAIVDGELYRASDLAAAVDRPSRKEFESFVSSLNGFFALIHETDSGFYAAVDRVQTIPLFYAVVDRTVHLSDDARWLADEVIDPTLDPAAECEFLLSGLVSGNETLYREIKQLCAGEMLTVDRGHPSTDRYYRFIWTPSSDWSRADLLEELDSVMVRAFERLIQVADGRPIAVSLSGGLDSRLVASMLVRLGYDDVIAFSYGRKRSSDVKIARRVADQLGIRWEFVEYSNAKWRRWFDSPHRERFYETAFDFRSGPSIVPFPAVGELTMQGRLPPNAVIVTGDSVATTGENLEESSLTPGVADCDESQFVELLLQFYCDQWETDSGWDSRLHRRIAANAGRLETGSETDPIGAFLEWDFHERQAKFLTNKDEYAYWGYDWWFPLFDAELLSFWQRLPVELLYDREIQQAYSTRLFGSLTGVDEGDRKTPEEMARTRLRILAADLVKRTPIAPIADRLWREWLYRTHPLAYYGIVPYDTYRKLSGSAKNVHSFTTLEVRDCVSFVDESRETR